MDGVKAYLGAAAVFALVLAPLIAILILGARGGRRRRKKNPSWIKALKITPAEWVSSNIKTRPK
jgi:hypothetical protein